MDSRSGSGDISEDCWLRTLRRERHRLLFRVSGGRINVAAGELQTKNKKIGGGCGAQDIAEIILNKWRRSHWRTVE